MCRVNVTWVKSYITQIIKQCWIIKESSFVQTCVVSEINNYKKNGSHDFDTSLVVELSPFITIIRVLSPVIYMLLDIFELFVKDVVKACFHRAFFLQQSLGDCSVERLPKKLHLRRQHTVLPFIAKWQHNFSIANIWDNVSHFVRFCMSFVRSCYLNITKK